MSKKAYKRLANKVDSLSTNNENSKPQTQNNTYTVKITEVHITNHTPIAGEVNPPQKDIAYSWTSVKPDGNVNPYVGSSSDNSKTWAKYPPEKGNTVATFHKDDIVQINISTTGIRIMSNAGNNTNEFIDLYSAENDSKQWLQGLEGANNEPVQNATRKNAKIRVLVRMEYDYQTDRNYEYYRELLFSPMGKLIKVDTIVKVDGFETTLHT